MGKHTLNCERCGKFEGEDIFIEINCALSSEEFMDELIFLCTECRAELKKLINDFIKNKKSKSNLIAVMKAVSGLIKEPAK